MDEKERRNDSSRTLTFSHSLLDEIVFHWENASCYWSRFQRPNTHTSTLRGWQYWCAVSASLSSLWMATALTADRQALPYGDESFQMWWNSCHFKTLDTRLMNAYNDWWLAHSNQFPFYNAMLEWALRRMENRLQATQNRSKIYITVKTKANKLEIWLTKNLWCDPTAICRVDDPVIVLQHMH